MKSKSRLCLRNTGGKVISKRIFIMTAINTSTERDANKTATTKAREFCKLSLEDIRWLKKQTDGVRLLWLEAAEADQFGSGGKFESQLKKTAFQAAKKTIEEYGAFRFERVPNQRDNRKTSCWKVFNLHGATNKNYWNGIESTQKDLVLCQSNNTVNSEIEFGKTNCNLNSSSSKRTASTDRVRENEPEMKRNPFPDSTLSSFRLISDLNKEDLKLDEQESAHIDRSGRAKLSASASAKAAAPASASSPCAKLTREDRNPEVEASLSVIHEESDENESTKSLGVGEDNKISADFATPETPQTRSNTGSAESDIRSTKPLSTPHTDPDIETTEPPYQEAERKCRDVGLLKFPDNLPRLAKLRTMFAQNQLHPISEGFVVNGLQVPPGLSTALLTEYLLFDKDGGYDEPFVCVKDGGKLTLKAWSEL